MTGKQRWSQGSSIITIFTFNNYEPTGRWFHRGGYTSIYITGLREIIANDYHHYYEEEGRCQWRHAITTLIEEKKRLEVKMKECSPHYSTNMGRLAPMSRGDRAWPSDNNGNKRHNRKIFYCHKLGYVVRDCHVSEKNQGSQRSTSFRNSVKGAQGRVRWKSCFLYSIT